MAREVCIPIVSKLTTSNHWWIWKLAFLFSFQCFFFSPFFWFSFFVFLFGVGDVGVVRAYLHTFFWRLFFSIFLESFGVG